MRTSSSRWLVRARSVAGRGARASPRQASTPACATLRGPPARAVEPQDLGVEAPVVVERADQVDVGGAEVGRGEPRVDHRHELGDLAVGVEPAELVRERRPCARAPTAGRRRARTRGSDRACPASAAIASSARARPASARSSAVSPRSSASMRSRNRRTSAASRRSTLVHEGELGGRVAAVVGEAADVAAMRRPADPRRGCRSSRQARACGSAPSRRAALAAGAELLRAARAAGSRRRAIRPPARAARPTRSRRSPARR